MLRFLKSQPDIFDENDTEGKRLQEAGDYKSPSSGEGKKPLSVRQQYIALGYLLQDFEAETFKTWESEILVSLKECLHQSILIKRPASTPFQKVSQNLS